MRIFNKSKLNIPEKSLRLLIGIPVLNNLEITRASLLTLFRATQVDRLKLDISILILDNGSSAEIWSMIRNDFPDPPFPVYFLRNAKNMGVAIAWNQILRFSPGIRPNSMFYYDYYVIANNDVFFGPDWLQPMIENMENDRTIGWISTMENGSCVLPELVTAHDISKQHRIDPKMPYTTSAILGSLDRIYEKWGGHEAFCRYVKGCAISGFLPYQKKFRSAACFMVRPEMVAQIGFFDEDFAPIGISEDLEYFLRIEQIRQPSWLSAEEYPSSEKWRCGFSTKSIVHHHWCCTHQGPDFDGRWWDKEREKNWQAKFGRSKKYYTALFE